MPGFKRKYACQQYNISTSAMSKILKEQDQILELANSGIDVNMKANNPGKNSAVEQLLYEWYVSQKNANVTATGPMLRAKAKELSTESGTEECNFSSGWLDGFRRRYNLKSKSKNSSSGAGSPHKHRGIRVEQTMRTGNSSFIKTEPEFEPGSSSLPSPPPHLLEELVDMKPSQNLPY